MSGMEYQHYKKLKQYGKLYYGQTLAWTWLVSLSGRSQNEKTDQ